ncbi:hypothetical protein HZ993_09850 [Rhodoferax sp. AJA081-3]|uniref:hypothetical protein n=1 Tax=Rhodoferax sp. AJA081-3 TaxID=2752316 RepID=UPI001ADFAD7A|nr:hypothetical protein [Rhodoferax sp. AJA081-3]QTN30071.1 hypothetical protein HZ993_09850 [Rhodoferax sp. AJA081-3]
MKKSTASLAQCVILLAICLPSANAQGVEKSFAAFTSCTGSFFKAMEAEAVAWRAHTGIASNAGVSWIKTADRSATSGNVAELKGKPVVAGVTLTHYLDESSNLGAGGLYYYWGFKAEGTVERVAEQLKPLIFHSSRLRKDKDVFVRTEVKASDGRWTAVATQSGSAPGFLSTERAFLIEPDADIPNTVKVLCSLQGDITAEVLLSTRPDISSSDHPKRLNPNLFEETAPNDQAQNAILAAIAGKPDWKPKFKRVTYDTTYKLVEIVSSEDGLVNVKESYSRFKVQRQMAAGLLQLKSRMNTNQAVNVTDQLTVELPPNFDISQTLKFKQTSNYQPLAIDSQPMTYGLTCEVNSTISASKIFASLVGDAVLFNCIDDESKKSDGKAFLRDLGIFIEYTPETLTLLLTTVPAKPKYRRFDVER